MTKSKNSFQKNYSRSPVYRTLKGNRNWIDIAAGFVISGRFLPQVRLKENKKNRAGKFRHYQFMNLMGTNIVRLENEIKLMQYDIIETAYKVVFWCCRFLPK